MEFGLDWFLSLILLMLPAFIANSAPVVLSPPGSKAASMDGGRKFIDGKRLLGDGKTWGGFIGGVLAGTLTGVLIGFLNLVPLGLHLDTWFVVSFFLSLGAMAGDIVGSFIKRRLDVGRGGQSPLLDQLGFAIFSLAFASLGAPELGYLIGAWGFAFILLLSYSAHVFFNQLAFRLGIKNVPW